MRGRETRCMPRSCARRPPRRHLGLRRHRGARARAVAAAVRAGWRRGARPSPRSPFWRRRRADPGGGGGRRRCRRCSAAAALRRCGSAARCSRGCAARAACRAARVRARRRAQRRRASCFDRHLDLPASRGARGRAGRAGANAAASGACASRRRCAAWRPLPHAPRAARASRAADGSVAGGRRPGTRPHARSPARAAAAAAPAAAADAIPLMRAAPCSRRVPTRRRAVARALRSPSNAENATATCSSPRQPPPWPLGKRVRVLAQTVVGDAELRPQPASAAGAAVAALSRWPRRPARRSRRALAEAGRRQGPRPRSSSARRCRTASRKRAQVDHGGEQALCFTASGGGFALQSQTGQEGQAATNFLGPSVDAEAGARFVGDSTWKRTRTARAGGERTRA